MQFNKNKTVFIHQWYPFVEGYSKEFIESILNEIDYEPTCVLEPFSGSGTTALELQLKNINCVSFEVSPFMHLLSSVKLHKDYKAEELLVVIKKFKANLKRTPSDIRNFQAVPFGRTVVKNENLKKWNFNDAALDGILDLKKSIGKIKDQKYRDLFRVILGSILLEVSNVFRNGKCLSYKKNWESKEKLNREVIHGIFLKRLETTILPDIIALESMTKNIQVNNLNNLHFGDVRQNILNLPDDSVDLIVTSPPYLNSRDYTDIYMLELKVLDLIKSHEELIQLRKSTLRSHVQVKHGNLEILQIPLLSEYLNKVSNKGIDFWNTDLLNMIKGYFLDMDLLFDQFKRVIKKNKIIYFNVANSAYFGEEIKVDEIICDIAFNKGFEVIEIRKARDLKSSSQQSGNIKSLRESVIVIKS
ncbi:DNA modification methylase [Flavobacterium sp. fv08]|uniref:DNA modification methylase n=1 Tax=Flavobacterium sp. fv08 TaxID=1761784 RepID=UPI000B88DE28|nr:DNA modification methylase [Flavobacterium sp. fv08]